jgi:hypothetical protein
MLSAGHPHEIVKLCDDLWRIGIDGAWHTQAKGGVNKLGAAQFVFLHLLTRVAISGCVPSLAYFGAIQEPYVPAGAATLSLRSSQPLFTRARKGLSLRSQAGFKSERKRKYAEHR